MWSYYGAKTNIIHLYPKPKYQRIIEPFAGTARYALKYFDRDILLVDKYEVIVKIWQWLQKCSEKDILSLPRKVEIGQTLDDFTFDCIEAKWLMGFLIKKGVQSPTLKTTKWCAVERPNFTNFSLQRIAKNLFKIRHWEIRHDSYENIENKEATWFIDPPYQFGGHAYKENNKKINFSQLSEWCKGRRGQVMVCETTKANWMEFTPMVIQKGTAGKQREAIWCSEKTVYHNTQTQLF